MKTRLKVLKDKYFEASMLRWGAVGITTTVIDYLLFISLYGPTNSVFLANLVAASVATSINYYTHHRSKHQNERQFLYGHMPLHVLFFLKMKISYFYKKSPKK
jgi:putative flippase GtrA